MTVNKLIKMLKNCDGDAEVHFGYDSGDHVHTTVCPVVECVEDAAVRHSDYHNKPVLVDDDFESPYEDDEEDNEILKQAGIKRAVILMSL